MAGRAAGRAGGAGAHDKGVTSSVAFGARNRTALTVPAKSALMLLLTGSVSYVAFEAASKYTPNPSISTCHKRCVRVRKGMRAAQ